MTRSISLAVRALVTLALWAPLAQAAPGGLSLQPGSRLWLTGTSTIHDYKSEASQLEVSFTCDASRWPVSATGADAIDGLIRANGVTAINVGVGVTGLKSGKDGLDKNMYKALLSDKHPEIRFILRTYKVGAPGDTAGTTIEAVGMLTVAGVEHEVTLPAIARREGDALRLTGRTELLMSRFGIKPPKMMLGTIKTADKVTIHIDLVVAAAEETRTATGTP